MCGIAGQIRFDGTCVERATITAMCNAIRHRGPDGHGQHISGPAGLGHRRLAVIDAAGSPQPMGTSDGQAWLTYNGEIYNFQELRTELEALGHEFATRGDTEVILHAWRAWGRDCVHRLRGMFAFALVDFGKREFLLTVDHFGIKPLLYSLDHTCLRFASEMVALESDHELLLTGDLNAVDWFLRQEYVPPPNTIYHEVKRLMPGHRLFGSFDTGKVVLEKWWQCRFEPDCRAETDWLDLADHTLQESVRRHTIADVPLGMFLSGGVDSSLVAMYMKRLGVGPEPVFTVGFSDPNISELEYANRLAAELGIRIESCMLEASRWDNIEQIILQHGELFADTAMLPTWHLCKFASEQVTVCLSGEGADEAFGGYRSYGRWIAVPTFRAHWKRLRRRLSMRELRAALYAALYPPVSPMACSVNDWLAVGQNTSTAERKKLWLHRHHAHLTLTDDVPPPFLTAHEAVSKHERLAYAQEMDFQAKLPGKMLPKIDIASMAFGLEVRTPLLDVEVVSLAQRLPLDVRYSRDASQGKLILKQLLQPLMGADFVFRKKQGFGVPMKHWFLVGNGGWEGTASLIADHVLDDWFDAEFVSSLLRLHSRRRDLSSLMWPLFVLGTWRRARPEVPFLARPRPARVARGAPHLAAGPSFQ